jgi:tRNA threonylcarbamoyl adenosine modification protein (Sua5/YciO/YrdC/YwlC family)
MLLEINPNHPEPRKLQRAVAALEAGEIIAYPTDTVYGLGCDLFNRKGIDRLYSIKGMDRTQNLAFVCRDLGDVARYAVMHDHVYRVLKQYLPGPYTFILESTREVPKVIQSPRRTVGVRIPNHEVALGLVRELGRPIISTSAARHGAEANRDPRDIDTQFPGLALVLDVGAGETIPTTVVDLTQGAPRVIRAGAGDVTPFEE